MQGHVDIIVVAEDKVTSEQADEMLRLQIACFSDQVTAEEVEEDFDRPPVARVLVYHQGGLIACAEVFKREVEYGGQEITRFFDLAANAPLNASVPPATLIITKGSMLLL